MAFTDHPHRYRKTTMALIDIGKSVGRKGQNELLDVTTIGAALLAVVPQRGGLFAVPLSIEGLAQAIESFQRFQRLASHDGRVDRGGKTLERFNDILNPGLRPAPPVPKPAGTGALRPLSGGTSLVASVDKNTWSPVESSLVSEMVFKWTGITGKGRISYFELDENDVPRWFGVLVPDGVSSFDKVHLFFHPTPGQAGYQDAQYQSLGNWTDIFHYLTDPMAAQFCAAGTGRVLVMPLMTQSAASTCGMFPQRWESIVGGMLGMLKSGNSSGTAPPVTVSSMVVSSFSSGITYSHHFRAKAALGARLAGVIDFDGGISSYGQLSGQLSGPAGRVVRMQQMPSTASSLGSLAGRNIFPLGHPRWGGPYEGLFPRNEKQALLQIHGTIPQTMMAIAARRAG